jgi:16S rRNA C967 or C1407 C5-methylase (RsmB/RsmF family)
LLDAPCSGSGTLNLNSIKSIDVFTQELINRSVKTQVNLIKKVEKILRKDGELIYSTCSILKEENEKIIDTILQNGKFEIIPIDEKVLNTQLLPTSFNGTICVMPNKIFEGFFIAKLRKKV